MTYNREIEKKYIVLEDSWQDVEDYILIEGKMVEDSVFSTDLFWFPAGVDCLRLREHTKELTVKVSDKGTTLDRIEENVVVDDIDVAHRQQTLIHGSSQGIEKFFSVYRYDGCDLSLYTVTGSTDLYFEIEGDTLKDVDRVSREFEAVFVLKREYRALYNIFLKRAQ